MAFFHYGFYICVDLQELLQLSKDSSADDLGMLTPPGSDASSDSENSLPGSPVYEEMGKVFSLVCTLFAN